MDYVASKLMEEPEEPMVENIAQRPRGYDPSGGLDFSEGGCGGWTPENNKI